MLTYLSMFVYVCHVLMLQTSSKKNQPLPGPTRFWRALPFEFKPRSYAISINFLFIQAEPPRLIPLINLLQHDLMKMSKQDVTKAPFNLRHIKAQASYHRHIPLTNFVHLPALQKNDQLHQHSKAHSCLSVSNSFSHSSSLPSNPRHSVAFCGHFSECQFHWKQPVM